MRIEPEAARWCSSYAVRCGLGYSGLVGLELISIKMKYYIGAYRVRGDLRTHGHMHSQIVLLEHLYSNII